MEICPTGVAGLDEVLGGGLPRGRMYLVTGPPGAGKTTLALRFLLRGVEAGESGLYVTLSETEEELRQVAGSHGWTLDGITIVDLQTSEESLKTEAEYTLFHPSDVELSETTQSIMDAVERAKPKRIVFDSLSEMRLLARDSLRYRRQILALKQYFNERSSTVLLLDTGGSQESQFNVETLAHGVVSLEQLLPEYGGQRRRLRVQKVRGGTFRDGYHDFKIHRGGVVVFPRILPDDPARDRTARGVALVSSGIPPLDELVGGGLDRGTSNLLLGPAGVGKSTLTQTYVLAAAQRGERATVFLFDESPRTWLERARGLGLGLQAHVEAGRVALTSVNPAQLSPGEFSDLVHAHVSAGAQLVVIDSLNGYQNAMPEERFLALHLHELLTYLANKDVLSLLVMTQHGLLGEGLISLQEVSYIADTVLLLRFFESAGHVRQAVSVVKKRTGDHGRAIRELRFGGPEGVVVGRELTDFDGVLSGRPEYRGPPAALEDARQQMRAS